MISIQEYEQELTIIREHCCVYVQVRLDHVRYLKGDASSALVLSYMLNLLRMKNDNKKDREQLMRDDLFFSCPAKEIRETYCMGEEKTRTAIKNLKEQGLIQTKYKVGRVMWVRINSGKLVEIVERDRQFGKIQNPRTPAIDEQMIPNGGGSPFLETGFPSFSNISKNLSKRGESAPPIPVSPSFGRNGKTSNGHVPTRDPFLTKKIDPAYYSLTDELRDILRSKRPAIPLTQMSRDKCAIHFQRLAKQIGLDRITKVLAYYKEAVHTLERPTISGAKQFCERFTWLEDLMNADRRKRKREGGGFKIEETKLPNGQIRKRIVED